MSTVALQKSESRKALSKQPPQQQVPLYDGDRPHSFSGFPIQTKLTIGSPNDKYEREADAMANRIMRMPMNLGYSGTQGGASIPSIQTKCAACAHEEERIRRKPLKSTIPTIQTKCAACENEKHIQRKPLMLKSEGGVPQATPALGSQLNTTKGSGNPLPSGTNQFMSHAFGTDFSHVRVHTDGRAQQMNQGLNARAFTHGSDIYFNRGEYNPGSSKGKRLLGHELTHVVQQRANREQIQRTIIVGESNRGDPAENMDAVTRNDMINSLVQQLGSGFTVVGRSTGGRTIGEIVDVGNKCEDVNNVVGGSKPLGNCCLCVLTQANTEWTIRLNQNSGAFTNFRSHEISIPPSTSPAVSGHFTQSDTRVMRPRVITFAHELCGHAALEEMNVHPGSGSSRARSTRHDPTIRSEQGIWNEQGLNTSDERGLASSPVHRGESFTRIVVQKFPFDISDPDHIPSSDERNKIDLAVRLATPRPDRWVDIVGHSDPVGSSAAKQHISEQRAEEVKQKMERLGVSTNIRAHRVSGPRFGTKGMSDRQPLTGRPHEEWRRVEIFLSSFPAGAEHPPLVRSINPSPVGPRDRNAAINAVVHSNSCERLLIDQAWPSGF